MVTGGFIHQASINHSIPASLYYFGARKRNRNDISNRPVVVRDLGQAEDLRWWASDRMNILEVIWAAPLLPCHVISSLAAWLTQGRMQLFPGAHFHFHQNCFYFHCFFLQKFYSIHKSGNTKMPHSSHIQVISTAPLKRTQSYFMWFYSTWFSF